jgi:fumarate hydratase, class II
MPVMARNLLESIRLLANVTRVFAERCVSGIEADIERCRRYAEASPAVATALNPIIGYEKAAELVKQSLRSGRSLRELVEEEGLLDRETLDKVLDVLAMTKGGVRQ